MKSIFTTILVAAFFPFLACFPAQGQSESKTLTVYCAAGLKNPLEAIAKEYEEECHVQVSVQYGGSGQLLSSIEIAPVGDLYIAADGSYITAAQDKKIVEEALPVAGQKPVLAVRAGNPKQINSIKDLERDGVKFALANPESASIGKLVQKVLTQDGEWNDLVRHVTVMKPTVSDCASDLKLGTVDAAFVWDATVAQMNGLETVPTPEFAPVTENATAGVLACSKDPAEALRFARYLTAPDRGGLEWKKYGYTLADGDPWQLKPELKLFIGSVNRPAVQGLLQQFANREGVSLTTVYNGCGILCATMRFLAKTKDAKIPDAYYACDICFVPPVADLYPEAVMLTDTHVIIAVQKGNPKNIHSLVDLARPGLKVGIGNCEQSSLGFITKRILDRVGLYKAVAGNACSQEPTADLLGNQLLVGSLDAAVVYTNTVRTHADKIDTIPINDPSAKAVEPFSVARNSPNRQLAKRLLAFLEKHRDTFEAVGFHWRDDHTPMASANLPAFGALLPDKDVNQAVPPQTVSTP